MRNRPSVFVSETEFDRAMVQIMIGSKSVRTITFPSTVIRVQGGAFEDSPLLKSAILNEGLERLGECEEEDYDDEDGVFCST